MTPGACGIVDVVATCSRLLCWRLRACRRSDAALLTATDRPTTTTEYRPAVGVAPLLTLRRQK